MSIRETKDKYYLQLQFWNKIYQKNGTEFQSFFEEIMRGVYSDFKKIMPYGNQGDKGNDGYRPSVGIFYQVYSPKDPSEKHTEAAKKLQRNFKELQENWDEISKINEYNFVFNDKNIGSSIVIESALAQLQLENQNIRFKSFVATNLEEIFFKLPDEKILSLGFDIDTRNTIKIAKEFLEKLEMELDRDNAKFVLKALENLKDIISSLSDEELILAFEILEARTLQKREKIALAKEKFEKLIKAFPQDIRSYLYLAEIYINEEDFLKNKELLGKAEDIDKNYWLLELENLIRKHRLRSKVDVKNIDENKFPKDPITRANFYRIYALDLEDAQEETRADSFIEKAILLNPNKLSAYNVKLTILERRLYKVSANIKKFKEAAEAFLLEIQEIENRATGWGEIGERSKALLSFRKFNTYKILENLPEIEKEAKNCFNFLIQCHLDYITDQLLAQLLKFFELPPNDFKNLLQHVELSQRKISDELAKSLTIQFSLKGSLLDEGTAFFTRTKNKKFLVFTDSLKSSNQKGILKFLSEDPLFAIEITGTLKQFPELRLKIIENLPNDKGIQKERLLLLLNYDEGNLDEAFKILKNLDLSNMGYLESSFVLKIAQQKKAWDFVIILIENLLKSEKDPKRSLNLKLQLFTANFNIDRYKEAIKIGETILRSPEVELLEEPNDEILLGQTIIARLKRGEFKKAKTLLEKNLKRFKSFEFILDIKTDVYVKNQDPKKAIAAIVEGICLIKTPNPEQYGRLFLHFTQIGNMLDFSLKSNERITDNSFVKFKDMERWFYFGNENELDASKVEQSDTRYNLFLNKRVGDKIIIENKYGSTNSEYIVEEILEIDKYILWQCRYHFEKLTREKRWNAAEIIETPTTSTGDLDLQYIIARLEDLRKSKSDFFNLYCEKNLPLAFLAANQGGLTEALGSIINENRGFIKFVARDLREIDKQKDIAKKMLEGEVFYLDGTSALVLSETGLLSKIYKLLPNMRVPQSVINFLLDTKDKFRFTPGQLGHIAYSQGKVSILESNEHNKRRVRENFSESIKLLESKPERIEVISTANKHDSFLEQRINPYLCDACILAQKNSSKVLTEDFLYLTANQMETKKTAPEYTSSFALVRVLYEQGKLSFEEYLSFFSYLSHYRFSFLQIEIEDIEKAVLGDKTIKVINPNTIRLFNFPLTLSEDYGVPFDLAFKIMARFLIKLVVDDSIFPYDVEKVFAEILSEFPTKMSQRELGKLLLRVSVQVINNTRQVMIVGIKAQEKLDILSRYVSGLNP